MSKPIMEAKMQVVKIKEIDGGEKIVLKAIVQEEPSKVASFYEDEPKATLSIEVTNTGLSGQFSKGDIFKVDFTEV